LGILGSFLGLGLLSIFMGGFSVANVSFIMLGLGLTVFQIAVYTGKDPMPGGMILFCATVILSGTLIIYGLTSILPAVFGSAGIPALDLLVNQNKFKALSYMSAGLSILGLMVGFSIGGSRGKNKDRNIISGIFFIVTGLSFIGLSSVDIIYTNVQNQGFLFAAFGLGLVLGAVCGLNLLQLGVGMLCNNSKLMMNNMLGSIFGFIGLSVQWLIDGQYSLGVGAIFFISAMLALPLSNNSRKAILISYPVFLLCSLFFCGTLIYYGKMWFVR
jgi:hypothetical protein